MGRQLKPCGTNAAFSRHVRRGEEPCQLCREARRAYDVSRRQAGPTKRGPLQPCGTNAAYQRHLRAGEEPCQPCRDAMRAYHRANHAERNQPLTPDETTQETPS